MSRQRLVHRNRRYRNQGHVKNSGLKPLTVGQARKNIRRGLGIFGIGCLLVVVCMILLLVQINGAISYVILTIVLPMIVCTAVIASYGYIVSGCLYLYRKVYVGLVMQVINVAMVILCLMLFKMNVVNWTVFVIVLICSFAVFIVLGVMYIVKDVVDMDRTGYVP